jgi:DNA polymerase III epsilon subunit-like protein
MDFKFVLYVLDSETTSLNKESGEIIELSILRINDEEQRTFLIKPENYEAIEKEALRINGHKIEDLRHQTQYGKDLYRDPKIVLAEIENWMMSDNVSSEDRIMVGQNVNFDLGFLQEFWKKYASLETFPWGLRPRTLDTMQLALFLDIIKGERSQYYNLGSLVEKFGVRKQKQHRADTDTVMCKDVFLRQIMEFKKLLK